MDQTVTLRADQTLNFTLKKSGTLLPTMTGEGPAWTRHPVAKVLRGTVR